MRKQEDRADITRSASFWISDAAAARFKSFCDQILNIRLDEVPTEQSIFTRQSFSIVFYATILFLMTNGLYLVKNIVMDTMIVIDMVPLYMMVFACLAMLIFLIVYKEYGTQLARYALLAFYVVNCRRHRFHGLLQLP